MTEITLQTNLKEKLKEEAQRKKITVVTSIKEKTIPDRTNSWCESQGRQNWHETRVKLLN